MDHQKKISKVKVRLMLKHPFFASIAFTKRFVIEPCPEKCYTDGTKFSFDPDFLDKRRPEDLLVDIIHMTMHIALMHHTRRGARDEIKWNAACDFAVDSILKEGGYDIPKEYPYLEEFNGLTADNIYNQLPQMPGGQDSENAVPGQVRQHPSKDAAERYKEEALTKQMVAAAAEQARQMGKLPAGMDRFVHQILEPKVPWREKLQRFFSASDKSDYTYKKPNHRYLHSGFYMPSMESEVAGDIVLIVDTSGSVGSEELSQVAGEVQDISHISGRRIQIIYVDAEVAHVQDLDPDEPANLEAKGGGGTSFRPGFDWIEQHGARPDAVVYLTDGYCDDFPAAPGYPVMWALFCDNEYFAPPFGEVIHIEDEQK